MLVERQSSRWTIAWDWKWGGDNHWTFPRDMSLSMLEPWSLQFFQAAAPSPEGSSVLGGQGALQPSAWTSLLCSRG
jgi:hypothetical protein